MKKERAISISLTNGAECICDPDIVLGDKYGLWDINNEVSPRGTLLDLNTAWELFISKQGLSGYTFEQQEDSEHERITYILVDKDKNPVGPKFTVETDNGEILVPITETITSLTAEKGKYYRLDVPVETLAITLPAMGAVESVKKVGIYFTAGTTPDVTITAADNKSVVFQNGYEIEAGKTYKVNALFDGSAWIVSALTIILPPPMNIITYEASAKLEETTTFYLSGLHTNAFSGKSGQLTITSHTFENGVGTIEFDDDVTSIGQYAFYQCTGLTSVTIPNSVTSIGDDAFSNCSGLTSITIPDNVTSIDVWAFNGCYFASSNFVNNSSLDEVTNNYWGAIIVDTDINGLLIKNNEVIKYRGTSNNVAIPNTVTSIGEYAFSQCTSLTSVTIGSGVTSIGQRAFYGCSSLTSIVVNSANTVYDSRNNCNAIINTSTNELVRGCNNTIIPNTVTSIGSNAFKSCTGLTSITIPDSVTSIGDDAFGMCSGLTSIVVDSANTVFDSRNNCNAIINTSTNELIVGCKNTIIPNTVISIGYQAFFYCSGLTSVTIPDSVTSIGMSAFANCESLTSITIPDSVTSIGMNAFSDCTHLTSVTIGSGVTSISTSAFQSCTSLTSVTIGNGVTSIGTQAFSSCSGLTGITIPNSVTSIGMNAFQSCTSLTSVTIGSGVTSIGSNAFQSCTSLTNITCNATTAPAIQSMTFYNVKTGGTLTVPSGSSGYDVWMGTGNYYLGKYNWTKVEQ